MSRISEHQLCRNCVFFLRTFPSPGSDGQCRAHPPVDSYCSGSTPWPYVPSGGWCGEYEYSPSATSIYQRILFTPIDKLPLPAHVISILKSHQILLIADLKGKTRSELLDYRKIGHRILAKIELVLKDFGISLTQGITLKPLGKDPKP